MAFTYRITDRRSRGLSLIAAKHGLTMTRTHMLDRMIDEWIAANPDVAATLSLHDAIVTLAAPEAHVPVIA